MIKRMEPLAEENQKLKEAMNLMEKNIQRAQRERDLAESNVWDLEYQKGIQFEQLAALLGSPSYPLQMHNDYEELRSPTS